jgi:Type VI secretion system (T6SS), amidase effector protein 4
VIELINRLNLYYEQAIWLQNHPALADELLAYLQTATNPLAATIGLGHLKRMMTDPGYLSFMEQYHIDHSNQPVWWENPAFLVPFGGIDFGDWAINYLLQHSTVNMATFQNQFMTLKEGKDGNDYDSIYWNNASLTFPPQTLPTYDNFNINYPKHNDPLYDTPEKMYNSVGGTVLALYNNAPANYNNTCALRVSKALNYSGVTIPNIPGKTFKGADNKYYFLGAKTLLVWMKKTFGTPTGGNHLTGAQGGVNGQNFPTLLAGKKGIYIMTPNYPGANWFGASGHADIINNSVCDGGCYFDASPGGVSEIFIWELL